ncbi:MAG: hypothetical protein CBD70_003350 [Acidimicrobiaceae bacterium TMED210]|nr:MAG: hypothetical protein CBD70_003350 [Acidimicrobiaceae bacterium TMED210]
MASFGLVSLVTVAVFFAGGFLAAVFFAGGFLAAGFLAAVFFAGGFLAGIIRPRTLRLLHSFQ